MEGVILLLAVDDDIVVPLLQQLDAVTRLPKSEQRFVSKMLDNVLGPNMGVGAQGQEAPAA